MKNSKPYARYRTSSQRQLLVNAILCIPGTPSAEAIRIVTNLAPTTARYMRSVIIHRNKIIDEKTAKTVAGNVIESYELENNRKELVFDLAMAIAKLKTNLSVPTTPSPSNLGVVINDLDISVDLEQLRNEITRQKKKIDILKQMEELSKQLLNI